MTENWQNSGFLAKFLPKFALFDEQKTTFLAAQSFRAYLQYMSVVRINVCRLVVKF